MITANGKNDLYKLLKAEIANADKTSTTLPNPSFNGVVTTTILSDINTAIGKTDAVVVGAFVSKDIEIFFGNYESNTKGYIAFVNLKGELMRVITQVDDPSTTDAKMDIPKLKLLNVTRLGLIYGLAEIGNDIYFIRFNDILPAIFENDTTPIDTYLNAYFNISTEIPKDAAKPTGEKYGYAGFKDYEKIDMREDLNQDNIISFALWKNADKFIKIIKLDIALGTQQVQDADWNINEYVNFGNDNNTQDATFADLSGIALAFGKKNDILGSLIVETSKTSTGNSLIHRTKDVVDGLTSDSGGRLSTDIGTQEYIVSFNNEIQQLIDFYKGFNHVNEKETLKLNIDTFRGEGTTNLEFNLDNDQMIKIKANNDLKFVIISEVAYGGGNAHYYNERYELRTGSEVIVSGKSHLIGQTSYAMGISLSYVDIRPRILIKASYDIVQSTTSKATTQSIVIKEPTGSLKHKLYSVTQVANNIYKGNKPVFFNSTKAFVPLLGRDDGQFNIYEFDGELTTTTEIDKPYNDITPSGQPDNSPYDIELDNVGSGGIVQILVDSVAIPSTAYTLTGNTLTIKSISKDKPIDITYKSTVGNPKKLILTRSTNGEDVFIAGVDNTGELGTTNQSIVGVGDDAGTTDFGFVAYSDQTNSNTPTRIAEATQSLGIELKHVYGVRQNNELFIIGYNADFTKRALWISIYPESFEPYTYLPFDDKKKEFHIKRMNGKSSDDIKDTIFDAGVSVTDNQSLVVATANAKTTDFNFVGDAVISLYGSTNKEIFKKVLPIDKNRQETLQIGYYITTNVIDITNGDVERVEASKSVAKVFATKNVGNEEQIEATYLKVIYTDDTFKEIDITQDLFIENDKLVLKITLLKGQKDIKSIQWLNKAGNLLGESTNICDDEIINITWELEITNTKQIAEARWDGAKWNEAKWK